MKPRGDGRTVLLIKLGNLGDVIQASYAAYELKQKGFKVFLLTNADYAACFSGVDYISCSVSKEFIEKTKSETLKEKSEAYRRAVKSIIVSGQFQDGKSPIIDLEKFKNYDVVVDLDGFPSSMILAAVLRRKFNLKTIGWFDRIDYRKEHLTIFAGIDRKIYNEFYNFAVDDPKHGTARYRALLLRAGIISGRWERPLALFSFSRSSKNAVQRKIAVQMITAHRKRIGHRRISPDCLIDFSRG
jgi:hypothetical protein